VRQQVKRLCLSKLIRASSWLFTGGVTAGILGYLFQIIMGRMLGVSEYGVFSALLAMMMVVAAPMVTLSMIIARRVSAIRAEKDNNKLGYLFYWINQKLLLLGVVLLVFVIFNIKALQNLLLIEESTHLYLLLIMLLISFPLAVNNAYLQGLRFFKWLAFSGALATLFKIIIAATLVYFGLGVTGVLGAIISSTLIILILNYLILRPSLKQHNDSGSAATQLLFKSAIPVLLATASFAVMSQIDMVLVKHYFSEKDAGIYAAASILGKAVMYFPGGVALALFPMVAENSAGGKSSKDLMIEAIYVTALLSFIGALFYYFLSDYIILLLFGADYNEASIILKYYGFAIAPMSLIMVAEFFLIAMGRVLFAYLFMVVASLQLIAIYCYHDTLMNIVMILFLSGATLVIFGYGLLWREFKK